jgi:hypoxanthine phosphoribosyltransferase
MKYDFQNNVGRTVVSEEEIKTRIKSVAADISKEYAGKNLLILGILKGSFIFIADFIRELSIPVTVDFMRVKSYYANDRRSDLQILANTNAAISDFDVLILEDITDTGNTLLEVTKQIRGRSPKSLRVITLIDKPSRREVEFTPDISLFTIPDVFIIGYGLDYDEFGRNLPYIAEFTAQKEVINE